MEESTLKYFFESSPPNAASNTRIDVLARKRVAAIGLALNTEPIYLYCDDDSCNGYRFFEPISTIDVIQGKLGRGFVSFQCRNCKRSFKTYAVQWKSDAVGFGGEINKIGEIPSFGPHTPARLISMVGGEREYFLKGRRSESQGLGIAAFAYYRRVVENQKTKIFDEIIRVSKKINAPSELISDIEAARKETQFSRAVDAIKHGIPQSLLINGHNPLTLLHAALSEGLHAQTDEECLELATSIRVVLTDLVDRIGLALKEEAELNTAVSRLLKASAQKANKSN